MRRHLRAPTLAGAAVVLVASLALAAIALAGGPPPEALEPAAMPAAEATPAPVERQARAVVTTNVRAAPDRGAEPVAILPGGRAAEVLGRTEDGEWLQVAYPPGTSIVGWVPATNLDAVEGTAADLASVPVVRGIALGGEDADGDGEVPVEALPDLVVSDAFLLANGSLEVRIENTGLGAFDGTVGLQVMTAGGEILGVLTIGPTTLAPGRSATVSTGVTITEAGSYLLELDRLGQVRESNTFNNTYRALLVPSGG